MDQPMSPSARFYASRGNVANAQSDLTPHPVPEHEICPNYVPPFGHFQGFSAPTSTHLNISPTHDCHVPDELISPRMPIPNFHLFRGSPKPRVQELSDDSDTAALPFCQSSQHRVNEETAPLGLLGRPARPRTWQLTGSHHVSPPPVYSSNPKHTHVPAFAGRGPPMILPLSGTPLFSAPPHPPAARTQTYHVPSASDLASEVSIHGGSPEAADATNPGAGFLHAVSVIPFNIDDDSTIYPHDSVSTPSTAKLDSPSNDSNSCFGDVTRYLEEGVVEVHNVCLGATQRYLEALRVNWELRHGRDVAVPVGGGSIQRRRVPAAGGRGSPYLRASRRHRAASEDGGHGRHSRGYGFDHDDVADGHQSHRGRGNRVPRATNSLLQNTSYICDLIWRRALRDREDVLGAEACGCRDMGFLSECAETVVLYDAGEWEKDPRGGFGVVCQAARDLCRELKDLEGVERVNDIEYGRL